MSARPLQAAPARGRAGQTVRLCLLLAAALLVAAPLAGCRATVAPQGRGGLRVLAAETFLADMAQNVAGDRLKVSSLLPVGVDPHAFEPTPRDVVAVARCDVLIVNGAGFEGFMARLLQDAGGRHQLVEASAGLKARAPHEGETVAEDTDPHFWLDPNLAIRYVENIRDGLSQADPEGRTVYAANAQAYIAQLQELDRWVAQQVGHVPAPQRLLVTNHETLGYFADRYGFRIVGTVVPSVSSDASPSARELAQLIDRIKASGSKVVFLETGTNPQLADQVAHDTGIRVIGGLYTHSTSEPGGPAPTYVAMIRYDTQTIVDALR